MIPFVGEPRNNWIKDQYNTYRRRNNVGWVLLVITLVAVLLTAYIFPYLPAGIRTLAQLVGAIISLGLLGVAGYLINRTIDYYLPEFEDRLLCFLKPAVDSLRAYETYGKERDKNKALAYLRTVADLLGELKAGNLKFIRDGPIGKMLTDLQKNFRNGLLPTLKEADKTKVRNILVPLDNMRQILEQTMAISAETLTIWSRMISQYPARERSKPFWRKIPTKKSYVLKGLMVTSIPAATGVIGLTYINVEAAYLGAISMFGVMVLMIFSTREKQKGS